MNWKLQKNPSICSRRHLSYTAQKGVWAVFKEGETGSSSQGVSLLLLHNTKGLCLALVYSSGSCGLKRRRAEGVGLLFVLLFNELETPGCVSPGKTALEVSCWRNSVASGEHCYQKGPCTVNMSSLAEEQGYESRDGTLQPAWAHLNRLHCCECCSPIVCLHLSLGRRGTHCCERGPCGWTGAGKHMWKADVVCVPECDSRGLGKKSQ